MGMFISKTMDDNMKKQQEFMAQNQIVMLERQIQMQNQMRERQMAMQLARGRELFLWFSSFYAIATVGLLAGKKHNPGLLVPIVPLTFFIAYQYDLCYGTKMHRIRAEADRILDMEADLIALPHGLPSFSAIEAGRIKQKDEDRLGQSHDLFL